MARDFVYPHNNEKEFIAQAKILGIDELVFIVKKVPNKPVQSKSVKVSYATLLDKQPKKQKGVLLLSDNIEKVRLASEHPAVDGLFGCEKTKRDYIHHRGSGMNQVIAKYLAQKGKFYLFDIGSILMTSKKQRGRILARMHQNTTLLKKYKVRYDAASFARTPLQMRSPKDLKVILKLIESS